MGGGYTILTLSIPASTLSFLPPLHHFIHRLQLFHLLKFFNVNRSLFRDRGISFKRHAHRYFFLFETAIYKQAVSIKTSSVATKHQFF